MKKGDLVKIKWTTFAAKRRQKAFGQPLDEPGLILDVSGRFAEVLFPSQGCKTHIFKIDRLESINETG